MKPFRIHGEFPDYNEKKMRKLQNLYWCSLQDLYWQLDLYLRFVPAVLDPRRISTLSYEKNPSAPGQGTCYDLKMPLHVVPECAIIFHGFITSDPPTDIFRIHGRILLERRSVVVAAVHVPGRVH